MNTNLCSIDSALTIGVGKCDPKVGAVIALILSKEKKTVSGVEVKTAIQSMLSENVAVMLNNMQQRDAANEAAVTGTLAYGYSEELRGAIVVDNYVFPQGLCSQANHAKLVGFEGYAFALTNKGQLVGFSSENADTMEMFPVSVTAMDTTGVFADMANIQTDTLTVRYGELKQFVAKRMVVAVNFTDRDLMQPLPLVLSGTVSSLYVKDSCTKSLIDETDAENIEVLSSYINGASVSAEVTAIVDGAVKITLTPAPKSNDVITLQVNWLDSGKTIGVSEIYSYTV